MQEKTVLISGKEVRFRSSAAIPRLYRIKFKRDIFKDLTKLEMSYKGKTDEGEEMQIEDLEIFENVAYIMAYHADHSIPGTIDDWLDEFEMFSIYTRCSPRFWNCGAPILKTSFRDLIQQELLEGAACSGRERSGLFH